MRWIPAHVRKSLPAAVAAGLMACPAPASQPIWQPAIYCAALEFTRADMIERLGQEAPEQAGTAGEADLHGRIYLRIAAEALDCPSPLQLDAMVTTVEIGIGHRIELAAQHGLGPAVTVMPLASESELVCRLTFDPDLIESARMAEERSPPAPLCADEE